VEKEALKLFSRYNTFEDLPTVFQQLAAGSRKERNLFLPLGAANEMARIGIFQLCEELKEFIQQNNNGKPWNVSSFFESVNYFLFFPLKPFSDTFCFRNRNYRTLLSAIFSRSQTNHCYRSTTNQYSCDSLLDDFG
jgi:hypothetical protein